MTQQAKPVIKNKFWIVEEDGRQIGTIQAAPDGVVYVHGQTREKFPTIKMLSSKHNIRVIKTSPAAKKSQHNMIYNYPCSGPVYNPVYDVRLRLPLYTREPKSKSFYCAGFYLVKIESAWMQIFCPKKIILSRNEYFGPFASKEELNSKLNELTN